MRLTVSLWYVLYVMQGLYVLCVRYVLYARYVLRVVSYSCFTVRIV